MNARGIEVVDLKHTLPNLQTLLLSRSPFVYATGTLDSAHTSDRLRSAQLQRNNSAQNLKAAQPDDVRKKLDDQVQQTQ